MSAGRERRPGPAAPNPYDLSTWRGPRKGAAAPPGGQTRQDAAGEGPTAAERAAQRARGIADGSADPARSSAPADEPPESTPHAGGEDDEVAYDPQDLPRDLDTFELARRTVNRSRAAARDQGLYPISRKTQNQRRDLRDRSTSAPGFSGARPDPRDPQGIESVLRRVLGDLGWHEGISAGRVLEEWREIVGEQVAQHVEPVSLDAGVLVVSCSSSAWASQIRMITPQLITTIEEHVGTHVISELKVTGPAAAQRTWKKGRRTVQWRGVRDTYG